jgi:hypothetical protein
MIRSLLQCFLCISLCPLLAAQEVASAAQQPRPQPPAADLALAQATLLTSVKDRKIEMFAPQPVWFAAAKAGSPFLFTVDKDVVVGGVTVIQAKTPVAGIVTKVGRGSYERNQNSYINIRLNASGAGKPIKARIAGVSPARSATRGVGSGPNISAVLASAGIFVAVLLVLAVLNGDN